MHNVELPNERASVRRLLKSWGFEVKASESRPASKTPIAKKFPEEVTKWDIYVGIFGQDESDPSISEFRIATDRVKDRLIFIKKVKGERSPKITKFLEEIKNSEIAVYYREYDDVTDLDDEVQKVLISAISENYRKSKTGDGDYS